MGRIPVYLYDDFEWLPYRGTNISLVFGNSKPNFGFSYRTMDSRQAANLATELISLRGKPLSLNQMLAAVKAAREYYTYAGVLTQIELFLKDPFGDSGGYLTCTSLPAEARAH